MAHQIISFIVLVFSISAWLFYNNCPLTKIENEDGLIVHTRSGLVQGKIDRSRDNRKFYSWLSIPYAQPPVGQLRFSTPQPIQKWDGLRNCSQYGEKCPQMGFLSGQPEGSEDCLFLNIHVPKLPIGEERLLPVIAFFHGGSFILGSGADIQPHYFMDEDIIFVTVNYRLGLFGFTTTGDKNIRGNMGLKDQVMALKWLKENVENFSGDPTKIVAMGQSAGGASVHYLTLSKSTKGLFQKAISMSGVSILPWAFRPTEAVMEHTKILAKTLNCDTHDMDQMTQCLRSHSQTELVEAFRKDATELALGRPSKDGHLFPPTVEILDDAEAFLTQSPFTILMNGGAHPLPWMTGVTKDEGLWSSLEFYRDPKALDIVENGWDKCMQNSFFFQPKFGQKEASMVKKSLREFYFPQKTDTKLQKKNEEEEREEKIGKYTQMFSDGLFLVGANEASKIQSKFSPVYLYYYCKTGGAIAPIFVQPKENFINPNKAGPTPSREYGVCHADDANMLYPIVPSLEIKRGDADYKFSKDFVKLFVSFASIDEDEETKLEFRGTQMTSNDKSEDDLGPLMYLKVDDNDAQMVPEPFAHRTAFWRSINYTQLFSN